MTTARLLAAQALMGVVENGRSLNQILPAGDDQLSAQDRAFFRELTLGSCRQYFWLNAAYKTLVTKPIKDNEIIIKYILLVGIYQLEFLQTAQHAAINEAVEQCRQLDKEWACKLVNGVLRNILRQQEQLRDDLAQSDVTRFNHPKWLIKRLKKDWPDHWQSILEANNQPAPLTLRVNQQRMSRTELIEVLSDLSLEPNPCEFSEVGVRINPTNVSALDLLKEGRLSVQDEAAQLASPLLDPQSNDRVLDACAAPGGKTSHLLEQQALASVTALDVDAKRLERVQENLTRLNLRANLVCGRAESVAEWWDGMLFDRILLDVPCSATGVIRHHPDIKIHRNAADIETLIQIQAQILQEVWQTLKPGGTMVYSTCSLLQSENAEQMKRFLDNHDDAELIPIHAAWGWDTGYGRQLFPQQGGHDGFFYAKIKKANNP